MGTIPVLSELLHITNAIPKALNLLTQLEQV